MKKLFALINPKNKSREQLKKELKEAFKKYNKIEEVNEEARKKESEFLRLSNSKKKE